MEMTDSTVPHYLVFLQENFRLLLFLQKYSDKETLLLE